MAALEAEKYLADQELDERDDVTAQGTAGKGNL